uniref:NADH-ubiquinone oxidoreductase chain 5 n=1 Tax=Trialeurodes vaporariorum TaxID=88556 RepID=Q674N3_TRIVP|nr:NADH dehydrogenase subunit 5 [Trialeurodes vaporariorum]AAU14227.1 NADH dehydrogenase subunit 5 [Trialeurodes vaporariorum]
MLNFKATAHLCTILATTFAYLFFEVIKNSKIMMIEWNMTKIMCLSLKFKLMLDLNSMIFTATVMIITSSVILYSTYYMSHSNKSNQFMKTIMIFILSMTTLIFSANLPSMMLGWEGLGMSSFILIMFYKSKKALTSSFLTMMINRVGDITLIMSALFFMNMNSWSFETFCNLSMSKEPIMLMMVALFSKSAQLPLSSWLTEAMAAPTPVSALVHSSTLVTAGIYIMIRFESTISNMKMTKVVMFIGMITIIMAGMNSITEWDIKKTIALSTLMQLSIIFFSISLNLFKLSMFHLILHATFKALIFLCASTFINTFNTQDMRKMSTAGHHMSSTQTAFNLANLSMCGFPFMSGAYSKELIMEAAHSTSYSMISSVMLLISLTCSIFYSIKMMFSVGSFTTMMQPVSKLKETKNQKNSIMMLLVPSIIMGNKLNWLMNIEHTIPAVSNIQKYHPMIALISSIMLISTMMKAQTGKHIKNTKEGLTLINYMMFSKNFSLQMKNKTLMMYMINLKSSESGTTEHLIKAIKNAAKLPSKKMHMMNASNMKTLIMVLIIMMMLVKF